MAIVQLGNVTIKAHTMKKASRESRFWGRNSWSPDICHPNAAQVIVGRGKQIPRLVTSARPNKAVLSRCPRDSVPTTASTIATGVMCKMTPNNSGEFTFPDSRTKPSKHGTIPNTVPIAAGPSHGRCKNTLNRGVLDFVTESVFTIGSDPILTVA